MNPTTGVPAGAPDTTLLQALCSSELPFDPHPDLDDPEWVHVESLLHAPTWQRLGHTYSAALGTGHLAPGQVCALQHYAGRAVQLPILAWCADHTLVDMDHALWWARIDHAAATRAVTSPGLDTCGTDADPHALADQLLGHLDPIVDAATAAGPATRRVALGCVAASVAGAFALAHRCTPPRRRDTVESAARVLTGRLHAAGRPTVTMIRLAAPAGDRLVHDRHTCCLIRLGTEHRTCASCPRLPEADPRRRQHEAAVGAAVPVDLGAVAAR